MIERLSEFLRRRDVDLDTFSVVFDIGSRDGRQAIELSHLFPKAEIVAVECNPDTIDRCRRNFVFHPRVKLVTEAINSYSGRCPFYAIDPARTVTAWADGNPGASSLFVATAEEYPPEKYVQKRLEVDCVRVDDLCRQLRIGAIDLIWIDLQGAELLAFESAGALLDRVRYIHTEVSFRPIYKGQCLFDDVDAFLTGRGFKRCSEISTERWQQDLIYENTREFIDAIVPAGPGDREMLELSVRSVRNFVRDVRQIFVVGDEDPAIAGAQFVHEQFPFNAAAAGRILDSDERSGSYLRQLVKLYFPITNRAALENTLVVDPGTLFLQPCRFLQDGMPLLNFGDEYDAAHFEHMAKLHPQLHRMFAYSGITYCNLLKRAWLEELHGLVEGQHGNTPFWKCYLEAADAGESECGASDAEMYFNFCLRYHAGDVMIRRMRWRIAESLDDIRPDCLDYVVLKNDGRKNSLDYTRLEELVFSKADAVFGSKGRRVPDSSRTADEWANYSARLFNGERYAQAVEASDRALALDRGHVPAARHGIHARLHSCDWRRRTEDRLRITEGLRAGQDIIASVFHHAISDSESESLMLAHLRSKDFTKSRKPLWNGESYRHDRIRIAYISSNFRDHVVSRVIAGCFEHHDRMRFETTAISLGPDDGSEMRGRITRAFDRFADVQRMSDTEVAAMIRNLEIDIAIDLNGYSGRRRTGILARRAAPLQVNWLGYSGTMGTPFVDYIIADPMIIPPENRIHYSEKIVELPHGYMPADRQRGKPAKTPERAEAGLPEKGFVFASFNYIYKIGPELFDVWMRLLREIDGSVLWLRSANSDAMRNLWREASTRGVAPERIVFAPFVPDTEEHFARLRLADLFLDTLPYNAHATACDALWAGLPVVTCTGNAFAGRVGASLLHAIGLPELVTSSLSEYEELALSLARNPQRLAAIRARLARNRDTEPLFDTARFTRNLETAYTTMWERQQGGVPPTSFAVASDRELA